MVKTQVGRRVIKINDKEITNPFFRAWFIAFGLIGILPALACIVAFTLPFLSIPYCFYLAYLYLKERI